MTSLWRAIQVDPGYYLFWGVVMGLALMAFTVPIWWELRGIRMELQKVNHDRQPPWSVATASRTSSR